MIICDVSLQNLLSSILFRLLELVSERSLVTVCQRCVPMTAGSHQQKLPRGHVRCPNCSAMLPESFVNSHLDTCLMRSAAAGGAITSAAATGHPPANGPHPKQTATATVQMLTKGLLQQERMEVYAAIVLRSRSKCRRSWRSHSSATSSCVIPAGAMASPPLARRRCASRCELCNPRISAAS